MVRRACSQETPTTPHPSRVPQGARAAPNAGSGAASPPLPPIAARERGPDHGPQPCPQHTERLSPGASELGFWVSAPVWGLFPRGRSSIAALHSAGGGSGSAGTTGGKPGRGTLGQGLKAALARGRNGQRRPRGGAHWMSPRGAAPSTALHTPPGRNPQHHPSGAGPARRVMNGRGGSPAPPDVTPANGGAGCAAG